MDFFDKLGDTISSKSKQVAQKAKDLAELSKLNGQVNTEEEVIQNAYIAIGKRFFEECKENLEGEYVADVEKIKEANRKIDSLKVQINQLKGIIHCPNCGAEIPFNSSFCSSCGQKIETLVETYEGTVEESEEGTVEVIEDVCPNCGTQVTQEDYCTSCGTKLKDE